MKSPLRSTTAVLVLSACLLFTFSGCKKRLFDYRNKFVGDYSIETDVHTITGGMDVVEHISYQGKVYYNKKSKKGVITIVYDDGEQCVTRIDKSGTVIHDFHGGGFDKKYFKVNFENAPNGSMTVMTGTR